MALETLKGIEEIDGFKVGDDKNASSEDFIYIDHEKNKISFTIQNGPIKEVGVNGCQVDTVISNTVEIIKGLNKKFPCRENSLAITKLEEALMWLEYRKRDREARKVEGTNQK